MFKWTLGKKFIRIYVLFSISIAIIILTSVQVSKYLGFRINTSASMPRGLWKLSKFNKLPVKNDVVVLCPPPCLAVSLANERDYFGAGSCPNGGIPLLKPVIAVAGDHVEITLEGIKVNHQLLSHSNVRTIDGAGRYMPQIALGHYRVKQGQVWIVSSFTPKSFDSRYFGPVSLEQISHYARPVWLKDS